MFFQYHCIFSSLADADEADESPSRLAVLLGEGGAAEGDAPAAGETSMASKLRLCPRDEDWSGAGAAAAELSMADASEQREKSEGKGPADDDDAAARVDAIGGRTTLVDAADDEKEFMWSTSDGKRGRSGVVWVVVIGVEQDEGVEVVCGCGCMWRCDEMASASVERDDEADDGVVTADDGSETEGSACSSDPPLFPAVAGGDDDDVEVVEVEVGEKADATCGLLSRRGLGITGTDDAAAAAASC